MTPAVLTVADVAGRLAVSEATVLGWLAAGELPGVDVSRGKGPRRRWRVLPDDFAAFVERRRNRPAPARGPRRRKLPTVSQYV